MNTGGSNGIPSTWNSGTTIPASNSYAYLQGTSMAAPQVAAVAALMFVTDPTLAPDQIEVTLNNSARALPGGCCRSGIVDANSALAALAIPVITPGIPELQPAAAGQTLVA